MVKTLRITSVIVAVLAVGVFVFPVVFGLRSDEEIEQFLNSPGAIEKFLQAEEGKAKSDKGRVSPLVVQAEDFALYLNPPAPPPSKAVTAKKLPGEPITPAIKPRGATPKFKVIATSFCGSSPELSLALIDEPGKGRHWVREGNMVSHLTIERIKDGVVIAKGIKESFESRVEPRPPRRSLLMGSSSVSAWTGDETGSESTSAVGPAEAGPATRADTSSTVERMSAEEQAALAEKIFAELEAARAPYDEGVGSGKTDLERNSKERPATPGKRGSGPEATRISDEEAEKLGHLGQELENVPEDPDRAKARKNRREEMIRRRMEERRKRLAERRERLQKKDK
jgi:hypothetical protein